MPCRLLKIRNLVARLGCLTQNNPLLPGKKYPLKKLSKKNTTHNETYKDKTLLKTKETKVPKTIK
jgi:hypothetical protein